jgi:hypothetical protein
VQAVPHLCEFYPGICLTTEEKAWKNLTASHTFSMWLFLHLWKKATVVWWSPVKCYWDSVEGGGVLPFCTDMWHENAGLEGIRYWCEFARKRGGGYEVSFVGHYLMWRTVPSKKANDDNHRHVFLFRESPPTLQIISNASTKCKEACPQTRFCRTWFQHPHISVFIYSHKN